MVQAVSTSGQKQAFAAAIAGRPYFQALLGRDLALWADNPGAPTRLFTVGRAALAVGGTTAQLCGDPGDWEELDSFLRFVGVQALTTSRVPPAGWLLRRNLFLYGLPAGCALPTLPPPSGLTLDRAPSVNAIAQELFSDRPERRDHFYSETCTALAHGFARVVALRDPEGRMVSTVGAYAMANGEAYLAMGETMAPLRGRGIGGWLIPTLANELAGEGWNVTFLCEESRRHFYERLGFAPMGQYGQYEMKTTGI